MGGSPDGDIDQLLRILDQDSTVVGLNAGVDQTFSLNAVPLRYGALVAEALEVLARKVGLCGVLGGSEGVPCDRAAANNVAHFEQY